MQPKDTDPFAAADQGAMLKASETDKRPAITPRLPLSSSPSPTTVPLMTLPSNSAAYPRVLLGLLVIYLI
jgi:hypothetical protein